MKKSGKPKMSYGGNANVSQTTLPRGGAAARPIKKASKSKGKRGR